MPAAAKDGKTVTFRNTAAHRHKGIYERDPLNYYVEEIGCTEALLDRVRFFGPTLDPCAGSGNIVKACIARGIEIISSDIVHRRRGQSYQCDFSDWAMVKTVLPVPQNIISNPPYGRGIIMPIVRNMIGFAQHKVAILVQAPFLYSSERYELFQKYRPSLILHLSSRPSMPPGKMLEEGIIKAVGGKEDYLWIVWERGAEPITLTDWILLPEARTRLEKKQARAAARAGQD